MGEFKPGSFYWVIPANDPDTDEAWESEAQPARYIGEPRIPGEAWWHCLNVEGPSSWPMKWIGAEIIENDTYAKGFAAGLEAAAEIVEIICERFGKDCENPKLFRMLSVGLTAAIRAHARGEKDKKR